MYYLGKYGTEASKREYDRIIAEFVANGRQAFNIIKNLMISILSSIRSNCHNYHLLSSLPPATPAHPLLSVRKGPDYVVPLTACCAASLK